MCVYIYIYLKNKKQTGWGFMYQIQHYDVLSWFLTHANPLIWAQPFIHTIKTSIRVTKYILCMSNWKHQEKNTVYSISKWRHK